MKSIIVILSIILGGLFLVSSSVSADVKNCISAFNGGITCLQADNLEIDKLIQNPTTNNFTDNLDQNYPFPAGSEVNFKINLKNQTSNKLNNIKVTDTLPVLLEFVSASNDGKYNKDKNTITYEIDLDSQKSTELTLIAKVTSSIPTGTTCLINQAISDVQWKKSYDNTQFCIADTNSFPIQNLQQTESAPKAQPGSLTKGGKTIYATPNSTVNPNTGPEAIALFALIPTGLTGYFLRRKSI